MRTLYRCHPDVEKSSLFARKQLLFLLTDKETGATLEKRLVKIDIV